MITRLLLAATLVAAPVAAAAQNSVDRANQARNAYAACLRALVTKELEERTTPDAFQTKAAEACATEKEAFRTAAIAADTASGTRRPAAEQNATTEIEDVIATAVDRFAVYSEEQAAG